MNRKTHLIVEELKKAAKSSEKGEFKQMIVIWPSPDKYSDTIYAVMVGLDADGVIDLLERFLEKRRNTKPYTP